MAVLDEPLGQADDTPASEMADGTPRSALYRAVWRWHFYAGIFAIPVIVILSISGIVYLFKPEIESVLYGGQATVEVGDETVSYEEQLEAVQNRYPDEPVVAMEPPAAPNKATRFHLDNGGTGGFEPAGHTVFVSPYTGEIVGSRNNAYNPAQVAVQIHGSLMSANYLGDPKWGDYLLELVAGWTVVLVVTGIYLWWPRGRAGRSLQGTLIPRLKVGTPPHSLAGRARHYGSALLLRVPVLPPHRVDVDRRYLGPQVPRAGRQPQFHLP